MLAAFAPNTDKCIPRGKGIPANKMTPNGWRTSLEEAENKSQSDDLRRLNADLNRTRESVTRCRKLIESLISGGSFKTLDPSFSIASYNPATADEKQLNSMIAYTKALVDGLDKPMGGSKSEGFDIVYYVYTKALKERIRQKLASGADRLMALGAGYILGVDYFTSDDSEHQPDIKWLFE